MKNAKAHSKQWWAAFILFIIFYTELSWSAIAGISSSVNGSRYRNTLPAKSNNMVGMHNFNSQPESLNTLLSAPIGGINRVTVNQPSIERKESTRKKSITVFGTSGPSQPEHTQFKPTGASNVVDLFTGDFTYSIPLLDVGGYPVSIGYNSHVTMDQEASWVGLGWSLSPGAISRTTRGIPDDFNGADAMVSETFSKPEVSIGGALGTSLELVGLPTISKNSNIGLKLGMNGEYNSRTGMSVGFSLSPTLDLEKTLPGMAGAKPNDSSSVAGKFLSGALSLNLSNSEGASIAPSFSVNIGAQNKGPIGDISFGTNYNSRAGLTDMTVAAQFNLFTSNERNNVTQNGSISFVKRPPAPVITAPYTTYTGNFTANFGINIKVAHLPLSVSGNYARTVILQEDRIQKKPAYGYLHFSKHQADENKNAVTDVSRDKETSYRDNPLPLHIGIPSHNYDVFSVTGEGIGGMFRAYRNDIGFTTDHYMRSKSNSVSGGLDLGFGSFKVGGNLTLTKAENTHSEWKEDNLANRRLRFESNNGINEPVYLRQAGEMVVADHVLSNKLGGEQLVKLQIQQSVTNSPQIKLMPVLDIYRNGRIYQSQTIPTGTLAGFERQPRTQLISQYTVQQDIEAGKSKIISYDTNYFAVGPTYDPQKVKLIDRLQPSTRKPHHLSTIEITQNDGKRYEYSIPVYQYQQRELSYNLPSSVVVPAGTQLIDMEGTFENSPTDPTLSGWRPFGEPTFYQSQWTPAHATTFLLNAVYSPDYVDVTGDGPTEDDRGDAVRFRYSNLYGKNTTKGEYVWKTPYNREQGKATLNVNTGLKTDYRDDQVNMVSGKKEIWYLNSIESKTMIATFWVENRDDGFGLKSEWELADIEKGLLRLKEIRLYSRADFAENGTNANPVKVVHFEYDYSLCNNAPGSKNGVGKLTLKKIWFSYNGNEKGVLNPYVFKYRNNLAYQFGAIDHWGNYKDPLDNPGGLNNADFPYNHQLTTTAGKSQNVAPWALEEIIMPSGSVMKINYEADDYAYVQNKRAAKLFEVVKLGRTSDFASAGTTLYSGTSDDNENRYVFIKVPYAATNKKEAYDRYLAGLDYLYFKMAIVTPSGDGFDRTADKVDFVKFYGQLEPGQYGMVPGQSGQNIIWIKLKGVSRNSNGQGVGSPILKAALQFLRNNLPAKAFPNSQFSDEQPVLSQFARAMVAAFASVKELGRSFITRAKAKGYCQQYIPHKSFVRLLEPGLRKVGGGYRVKSVVVSDGWTAMGKGRTAVYGQEYIYTTQEVVGGKKITISSGVATYEPFVGGEENPLRVPIELYNDQRNLLGPSNVVYTEAPLMESFYPAASVGYSRVRVRSINYEKIATPTGMDETEFYTVRDFPLTAGEGFTPITDGFRKSKSPIRTFFKINSRDVFAFSQGFKIELNDMHGKLRSQSSYAYGDTLRPISKTVNFYRILNVAGNGNQLNNEVLMANRQGQVSSGVMGRTIDMMADQRQQEGRMWTGKVFNSNVHVFFLGVFGPIVIPAVMTWPQSQRQEFRAAALTKVVNKLGILDSVIVIDKGSQVSTKNLVYDEETGQVVVSRTNNEFDDPVYSTNIPAHWAYDRVGPAYKNNQIEFKNISIDAGAPPSFVSSKLVPGDELLATDLLSGRTIKLWATSTAEGITNPAILNPVYQQPGVGTSYSDIRLVTKDGRPFSSSLFGWLVMSPLVIPGSGLVNLRVTRSGRRNLLASTVGGVQSRQSPIVNGRIVIDSTIEVLNATAMEMKEDWRVKDQFWLVNNCNPVCECPDGYFFNTQTKKCERVTESVKQLPSGRVDNLNFLWLTGVPLTYESGGIRYFENAENGWGIGTAVVVPRSRFCQSNFWGGNGGRLRNGAGRWVARNNLINEDQNTDSALSFSTSFKAAPGKSYYFGFSADDTIRIDVNCQPFLISRNSAELRSYWNIFRVPTVDNEEYQVRVYTANTNSATLPVVGFEIYEDLDLSFPWCENTGNINSQEQPISPVIVYSTEYVFCPVITNVDTTGGAVPAHAGGGGGVYEWCDGQPVTIESWTYDYCSQSSCHQVAQTTGGEICRTVDVVDPSCRTAPQPISMLERINPYYLGLLGNYRPWKNYVYYGARKDSIASSVTNIRYDGQLARFKPFWKYDNNVGWWLPQASENWLANAEQTLFDTRGASLETKDPLNRYTAGLYGFLSSVPIAVAQNSKYREVVAESFEDFAYRIADRGTCEKQVVRHFDISTWKGRISKETSHTGKYSLRVPAGDSVMVKTKLSDGMNDGSDVWLRRQTRGIRTNSSADFPVFSPTIGDSMVISVWVKENVPCSNRGYEQAKPIIRFGLAGSSPEQMIELKQNGPVIEGWQLFEAIVRVPTSLNELQLVLKHAGTNGIAYFDDLRVHPYHSNMKSFVYDDVSLRLMAELDENNFATLYEYDDDGTLVRVKKETIRGIKTINETRTALSKQPQ